MYDQLTALVDETRLTLHRLTAVVERLHDGSGITVPMRAVLEFVRGHDPHTVAAIARARHVSRQHIQVIVNELLDAGLVERVANPHHRRAPLIRPTRSGVAAIDELHARERAALEPALLDDPTLTVERLAIATDVLRAVGAGADRAMGA